MPEFGLEDLNKLMVKQLLFLSFITLTNNWIVAQEPHQALQLTGTVLDADNGAPLAGVHIIVMGKTGTTTDLDGNFRLLLSKTDTVHISHVGYNEYLIPIPEGSKEELKLTIALTPSLTELEEIVIYQWPATLSGLKQKILAAEVPEEDKVVVPGSYQGPPKPVRPGFGSPISFLQSKFSKKIRKRQEFLKKRLEIESNQRNLSRYNPEYVMEITGIEDKQELDQFMEYCKLSDVFIAEVNDYDLILAINRCYTDFRSERSE